MRGFNLPARIGQPERQLKPSAPSLPKEMLETLLLAFVSFTVLFVALLRARYRLALERAALEMEDRR